MSNSLRTGVNPAAVTTTRPDTTRGGRRLQPPTPSFFFAHARAVLRFYLDAAERADYLIGPSGELTPPPKPREPRRSFHWKRDTARDFVLRMLGEEGELTAGAIRHRLERMGEARSRQGVNFVLLQLEREGKVERVARSYPTRWRLIQLRF